MSLTTRYKTIYLAIMIFSSISCRTASTRHSENFSQNYIKKSYTSCFCSDDLNLDSEQTRFYRSIVSIEEKNIFYWLADSYLKDVIISCDVLQRIEIGRCEVEASASSRWTTATFLATKGNNAFLSWSTGSDGVCFVLCSSSGKKLLENCDNGIKVSPNFLFAITYPPVGTPLVMSRTVQIYDLRTGYLLLKYELESETDVRTIEWLENYVRLGIVNKNGMESQIVLDVASVVSKQR